MRDEVPAVVNNNSIAFYVLTSCNLELRHRLLEKMLPPPTTPSNIDHRVLYFFFYFSFT
jgi:hypothetical protein